MAVKFLSHGHFSGSDTDLTLDGQLFLPSYTSSPAAPTISFDSNAGGIWYDSNDDQIWFRAGNSNRAYINSSGVVSQANVYTGTNSQFRNYAGVWKGTTGQTGNGFEFINSVDGTALTLSSTGNAVFTGNVTAVDITGDNILSTSNSGSASIYINSTRPTLGFTDSNSFTDPNDIYIVRGGGTDRLVFNWYDDSAGTTTETFNITSAGNATFIGSVTAGSFVKSGGTSSQYLMADGSVSTGGATIDGTGAANKLAIWSDADSLTNDTFLHWDTTNNRLGVNNSGPSYTLDVGGTSRIGGTIHMYGAVRNYSGDFSLQNGVQDADIFFKVNDGGTTTTAMTVEGSSSFIGIGTTNPDEKLHVMYAHANGTATTYAKAIIEDTDAQLDLLSTLDGTWGSGINFVEAAGSGANTDVWSIARQTTGGVGDSSLNFNFGTSNQHDNANKLKLSSGGNLTAEGSISMNQSNTQVTMSGNTSGNFTLDNNTGSIAFQANGSTVNSMTITSSAITLNENTTVTGTFDPQGNILGAVIDDGNVANPLQVRRSAASTMQVGINFTVSPSTGSGFSRYLGVDSSADLRFGSSTNHGTNALVLTTANYVSQFGSFAGDIVPSADSTYDLGSNASKWAEGHFDHLYVGETGNNPRIDIYTENGTASIADTFTDTSTDKSYIYFQAGTNSNDPGFIMHETSESASPDERNEGVLHLVPSDDNSTGDYVSIHGTNDPDCIKLHTSGLIETANYQLQLRSAVGDVYIDDGLTVNGTIAATGGTSTGWNEAHNNMIISASVSGTSTKTITLNQNDGGTITASWSDLQGTTVTAPNAPTNLSLSIVNNTVNVTFDASSTSGIDQYLVFGSANGGDYSLISVIEPASMGSTMSVIDDSFDDSGVQAYRVYAMKTGVMSSALSGSVTYTVSTPVEPTNMTVVNLNTAFYIQWDPPSSNARFVTAYNVYKHEHASQASLLRSSATLIYSGMNTSYMYEISGNNNLNYHQFWVETTVT